MSTAGIILYIWLAGAWLSIPGQWALIVMVALNDIGCGHLTVTRHVYSQHMFLPVLYISLRQPRKAPIVCNVRVHPEVSE